MEFEFIINELPYLILDTLLEYCKIRVFSKQNMAWDF